jgi:ssRNA-specific RNase YbeY (16S rRNA maturation enzyme)
LGYDDKTKKEKNIMSNLENYHLNEEKWENLIEK